MRKVLNKIICLTVAMVLTLGVALLAACGEFFDTKPLAGDISGTVSSQGGFSVQKGDYVYFINGVEGNTADNSFGTPVKGSIVRISKTDLANHNYSSVQTVVPQVAYSGSYNAGLYIYGDYIYFSTPSTARNSSGEVLNSDLDFKRAKLDGTEIMSNYYLRLSNNAYDYRYVEVNGVVYILYVATGESLFNETTGVTNIHSFNTQTGTDTILAYNVASVMFDSTDKTNPQIYYTMNVYNYATNANYGYNQVYTVRADETEQNSYDFSSIVGWEGEADVEEGQPYDQYINCGTLVYDGIGSMLSATPFNYSQTEKNAMNYTYALTKYVGGTLFYTRTSTNNTQAYLFSIKDSAITSSHNAITANQSSDARILTDGSAAGDLTYVFKANGDLDFVIGTANTGLTINKAVNGKLQTLIKDQAGSNFYHIVDSGTATVLFIDGDYLYYSIAGGNGYTFYRINYKGDYADYHGMPIPDGDGNIATTDYTQVQILDLDSVSDWYMPELVEGQLLFASETDSMTSYNYIMACDISGLDNAGIKALSDKYASIDETITEICEDLDTTLYANLEKSLKWAKFTGETEYITDLAQAANAQADENDLDPIYPEGTLTRYANFITPTSSNEWSEFTDTKTVNGTAVYSNRRDYYYTVVGTMTESDYNGYIDLLKTEYLQSYPEQEVITWWDGLNTAAKVCFIIGMCVTGLVVIGAATFVVIKLWRKRKNASPVRRRRIKVDMTDDKDIDVYSDGEKNSDEENS